MCLYVLMGLTWIALLLGIKYCAVHYREALGFSTARVMKGVHCALQQPRSIILASHLYAGSLCML